MLDSVKIQRRQSEIRQQLAALVGKDNPSDDETRSMEALDSEYRQNETRYRAALVAEDTERREAGEELETRSDREWSDMMAGFELRQVVLNLDEGRAFEGQTAEIVSEMRSQGGYRGIPVPLLALEQRAGETVTGDAVAGETVLAGAPSRVARLFPQSAAAAMGGQIMNFDSRTHGMMLTSSNVTAAWADGETENVGGPTPFTSEGKYLFPEHNLGVQMKITRRAMKTEGDSLERAIRADMLGTISAEMDKAIFQGTGQNGQPLGVVAGAAGYGITETAVGAAPSWAAFRAAVVAFMTQNAAGSPSAVKLAIRPEVWSALDGALIAGTAVSEWDRLVRNIPASNVTMSSNALAAPTGSPAASKALLTVSTPELAPIQVGYWGGIDMIRDPYSDAHSGGLRLTGLMTADVQAARPTQLHVLSGLQG